MRKAFQHADESMPDRSLVVEVDAERVRVVCDAPGVAAVSYVLSWSEWGVLVDSVDSSRVDEL